MSLTPFCGPNCGSAVPGFPLGQMVHDGDWHDAARRRHERAGLARGADEVMGRAYDPLVEAAQQPPPMAMGPAGNEPWVVALLLAMIGLAVALVGGLAVYLLSL